MNYFDNVNVLYYFFLGFLLSSLASLAIFFSELIGKDF